jgi:hypothetical protein
MNDLSTVAALHSRSTTGAPVKEQNRLASRVPADLVVDGVDVRDGEHPGGERLDSWIQRHVGLNVQVWFVNQPYCTILDLQSTNEWQIVCLCVHLRDGAGQVSGGIIADLHWCHVPRGPTEGANTNRSLDKVN